MTFGKWYKMFKYYQNDQELKVKGISYRELREQNAKSDEWL